MGDAGLADQAHPTNEDKSKSTSAPSSVTSWDSDRYGSFSEYIQLLKDAALAAQVISNEPACRSIHGSDSSSQHSLYAPSEDSDESDDTLSTSSDASLDAPSEDYLRYLRATIRVSQATWVQPPQHWDDVFSWDLRSEILEYASPPPPPVRYRVTLVRSDADGTPVEPDEDGRLYYRHPMFDGVIPFPAAVEGVEERKVEGERLYDVWLPVEYCDDTEEGEDGAEVSVVGSEGRVIDREKSEEGESEGKGDEEGGNKEEENKEGDEEEKTKALKHPMTTRLRRRLMLELKRHRKSKRFWRSKGAGSTNEDCSQYNNQTQANDRSKAAVDNSQYNEDQRKNLPCNGCQWQPEWHKWRRPGHRFDTLASLRNGPGERFKVKISWPVPGTLVKDPNVY